MKIFSLVEVCEQLKITTQTGRNRLSRGAPMPPSFRVGRRRLFRVDDFEKWIKELAESENQFFFKNSNLEYKEEK